MWWLTNYYDFSFKWTATAAIGIHPTKAWLSQLVNFKNAIGHQFLSGIRDSRKERSLWGMMRGVGGVRKSIHHSWLAKGLWLGLLCWVFKGVQEEITSEQASTLQIGSVAFPPEQYTSLQLHPCQRPIWPRWASRLFCSFSIVETLLPVTFGYSLNLRGCRYETNEEMKEAVTKVIDKLTQEDFYGALQKLLKW